MSETILVIEDETVTRNSLVNFLNSEGYLTLSAENGRVGIDLAQRHIPSLIICDIMMPELDGYDVLTRLQHNPETLKIPFIFLTSAADEVGCQQSLEMGADDYLSKPITSERLLQAINVQLEQHQAASASLGGAVFATGYEDLGELPHGFSSLMQSKDALFEWFCQKLLSRLSTVRHTVDQLQETGTSPETVRLSRDLQVEFVRLLSLVNHVSAVQPMMNPENAAALLADFTDGHSP